MLQRIRLTYQKEFNIIQVLENRYITILVMSKLFSDYQTNIYIYYQFYLEDDHEIVSKLTNNNDKHNFHNYYKVVLL